MNIQINSKMNKLLIFIALLFGCVALQAQDLKRITIKGLVMDTSGADMPFATIMLLNPSDSNLINFTRSDDKGGFAFKNVKNSAYLLKVSYVGYIPLQKYIPASTTEINDLGTVFVKAISTELNEVVIKAARSTLTFRGDTIEYDAASFKVPPGSTVEDLLRRLPGIEVDADGNIRAQGRDVQRLYVDGKTFFGDDPKAASKNLGAETISKVQVYNEKSEQTQLTGVDDGKKTKVMNLELKDEYKKGSFGKITGAIGTDKRWAARGNYNKFNKKEQFSILGFGNNINQTGLNWEDYGEFKGQNTWNNRDNGDFGFSGGNNRYYSFDGGDVPFSNNDGRGFSENYGGGANYNYDHKKTKANASYFYNETELTLDQYGFRQTFLPGSSFFNTDTLNRLDFKGNHSINGRIEQEIDSNNILIFKANSRFTTNTSTDIQNQYFSEDMRQLNIDNTTSFASMQVSASTIYRHKFKKQGRSFAVSGGYNRNISDGTDNLASLNQFFSATNFTQQIRQLNTRNNNTSQWRASLLLTEPLSKKWFLETFYNFANTTNLANRQVTNPLDENTRIDSLSLWFDNGIQYNRIGSSVRYSHNGANLSAGLAGQQLHIGGKYALDEGRPLLAPEYGRTFRNIVPYLDLSFELANNKWLNSSYVYGVSEPQFNDLQPVPNVNNPTFRTEGNPNLRPERTHQISLGYGFWNPSSLSNMSVGVDLEVFDDKITYNQTIQFIDSVGVRTTTRPDNISGGKNLSSYIWYGFPIIKTKLTANVNGNVNINQTPAFVNGIRNETQSNSISFRPGLSYTPSSKLIIGASGDINFTTIEYSIQQEQNQKIYRYGSDISIKWQMVSKLFFEGNFKYSKFQNRRFGFDQSIPILNASVRRLVGKTNRIELRLAAFDLLNRRVTINQNGSQNFVSSSVANTLARYYMLSVSYNVRGYENKIKKNDWW
ncbi:MAG: hypothetical protein RIR11_4996 [Bacteroidota bacterium]|jgi:hypothetical protein